MSYDVYFEIDTGPDDVAEVDWRNYTSNVSSMWSRALEAVGATFPLGILIEETPAATDLGPIVAKAADYMRTSGRESFADLEPRNGWGDYAGALSFLDWLAAGCERHPACRVRVSR